jgi:agmatine deiminase
MVSEMACTVGKSLVVMDSSRSWPMPPTPNDLPQPDLDRITGTGDDFVSTYANFYIANGAVFMPRFGDTRADGRAKGILQEHFPTRDIVPVEIDTIAGGGGGIHCSTHDQPGRPAA